MRGLIRGLAFVAAVGAVLFILFDWREASVNELLEDAEVGDVLDVESDECSLLKERELIDPQTDCGYWDRLEVRLIREPTAAGSEAS